MNVGFEVGGAFVNFSAGRMMGWKNRTYQRWSGTEQKTRRFKKVGRLEIFKQWNVWHQAEEVKNKKKEKVCQTLLAGCLRSWLEKFTLCHRSGWTKDWPKRRHQKQTSMWGLVGWRPRPLVVRLEWRVRIRTRGFQSCSGQSRGPRGSGVGSRICLLYNVRDNGTGRQHANMLMQYKVMGIHSVVSLSCFPWCTTARSIMTGASITSVVVGCGSS